MAKCKYWDSPIVDRINKRGMSCGFECPKNANELCEIPTKRKPKYKKIKAWCRITNNGEVIEIYYANGFSKEDSKGLFPCTIMINAKYLKGDK